MSETQDHGHLSIEELFAEYLNQLEQEPSLEFEHWLQSHAPRSVELRALHEAYVQLRSSMPGAGSPDSGSSVSESLERGHDILGELGSGAYGRVFRAVDRVLQREVALKHLGYEARITPGMRRRFLEEARVLARLDHPNIVRIHSVESEGDEIRLSLELVRGRTLQEIVEQDGPFSPEEAARVGIDLCRALAEIHAHGLDGIEGRLQSSG